MRIAAIVLLVALIAVGALLVANKRTAREQLAAASNEVVAAQQQVSEIRTQMQAKVNALEVSIEQLTGEKAKAEASVLTLSNELGVVRQELRREQAQTEIFAKESDSLAGTVKALTNQVVAGEKSLAELNATHATTVRHLTAMREDYVALTKEKTVLEAKLSDPIALRMQLRTLQQEQHARKVEERRREDRAETVLGNGGFLMKQGQWISAPTPGRYPLIQDIRREP